MDSAKRRKIFPIVATASAAAVLFIASLIRKREKVIVWAEAALKIYEEIEDPSAAKVREQLAEWRKHT